MTELLSRPPGQRGPKRPPAKPEELQRALTAAGAAGAARAALLSLLGVMVLVLVGWATAADSEASATAAVAAGLVVWLVGNGAAVELAGGSFSLTPLGLTAVPMTLLWISTARVAREARVRDPRGILTLVSVVTSAYAMLTLGVGLLSRMGDLRVPLVTAFLTAAALAAVVSTAATLHASGRAVVLWHRLPGPVRRAAPGAAAVVTVLIAGGALVAGLALALHWRRADSIVTALDAGFGGAVFLLLGCLLLVPNAVVWGLSFAVGPGFSVGAGTSVAVTGSETGPVPAVPLLAALPSGGSAGLGWFAVLVPVAAGVVAALVVRRSARLPAASDSRPGFVADLQVAGIVAGLAGAAVALLTLLSAGSAGPGRMTDVGPDWWLVGSAVTLEIFLVTALALLVIRRRS